MSAEQPEECSFCGTTDANKQIGKVNICDTWCWCCEDCCDANDQQVYVDDTDIDTEEDSVSVMTTETPDFNPNPDGGGSRGWNKDKEDSSEDDETYTTDSSDEGLFDVCYTEAQEALCAELQRDLLKMLLATLLTPRPTPQPTEAEATETEAEAEATQPKPDGRGAYPRTKEQLAQLAKGREVFQAKCRATRKQKEDKEKKKYGTGENGEVNYYQNLYNRANQRERHYMKGKVLCECGKTHHKLNIGRHRESELHKRRMAYPHNYKRWLFAKKQ